VGPGRQVAQVQYVQLHHAPPFKCTYLVAGEYSNAEGKTI
jgi:hypothetical protein